MVGIVRVIVIALLAASVLCIPGERLKRNYHNEHGLPTGFGGGSDERDASVDDSAPCGLLETSGPEHEYGFEGPGLDRRGVSVKAAAAASSSSYS